MGEQIIDHFAAGIGRITAFLPNLISAAVIVGVGYLLARLAGGVTRRILARVGFDRFAARHLGVPAAAPKRSASDLIGAVAFWLVMLVTASLAADTLRLVALSAGINEIIGFIPRLLVACIILAVAIPVSRLVGGLIGRAAGGALARAAQIAVMVLAVFMALDQLGVSRTIVTTTFAAVLGAAAIAAAIAFGVGNIGLARDLSERWATRGKEPIERPGEPIVPATH